MKNNNIINKDGSTINTKDPLKSIKKNMNKNEAKQKNVNYNKSRKRSHHTIHGIQINNE